MIDFVCAILKVKAVVWWKKALPYYGKSMSYILTFDSYMQNMVNSTKEKHGSAHGIGGRD